jgi:hypothetical protein
MTNKVAEACSAASLTMEGTKHPELVALLQMAADEIERLTSRDRLRAANDLLRSAYQIAVRDGSETNWPAFLRRLESELVAESVLINGTAHVPAATCTAKTFRLPQS